MRLRRWLGALLAPAEDPRPARLPEGPASPETEALLAELQRSRTEVAELRARIEARAATVADAARERLLEQARELADQEKELSDAEQHLSVSIEEHRAQRVLAAARQRAIEAEVRAL